MTTDELFVVPAERHVERLAALGLRAETRTGLRTRLAAKLLPDVRFADARETRLALSVALEEGGKQLDLFGQSDPLLATLAARGGASWVRAVAAIDEAIGALRARGATETHLDRVRGTGVAPARARTLAAAMRALDATLARSGARDGRLIGTALAGAIRGAPRLADVVGAHRLRARWLLAWEARDLEWWRALDETLSAVVVLPVFDKPLAGSRERDPLETIAEGIARQLDAAPETEILAAVLGDLATTPPTSVERVRVLRVPDVRGEARSCARLVRTALENGARVERIAIAYPQRDERTLVPLRRALAAESLVFHDAFGSPPASVPVVAAALHALVAAESLERTAVARLLRSGYVDAPRVVGEELSFREAERALSSIARRLETRATASGADAAERLVRTADDPLAQRVVDILLRARSGQTRGERVRRARGLFHELGFAARAGRGALGTFARDEAPAGVDRAERLALARDVRAWEILETALEDYETTMARTGASERPVDAEGFRLDLESLLESAATLPNAGRAGAVRVTRLADVVGDELDLLVVLDANEGTLPKDTRPPSLVSEALEQALGKGFLAEPPGARDLAALAVAAAESAKIAIFTTTEDTVETPAAPSRIIALLERAGLTIEDGAIAAPAPHGAIDVVRRTERERLREGFFLDPARPLSDLVGELAPLVARDIVTPMTGGLGERPLAVTSLERFAKCAFMGYAHVVLGARQGEEQRELPDAREEGNLGHTALAAAFLATREAWARRPRDRDAIFAAGLAAAESAIAAAGTHAPLRAIVRLRVRESVRAVIERALAEDDWDFILAEQEFGPRGWPAFAIDARLWLRGSIDRVDRAHGGKAARVIDYKRSKSTVRDATASLGETAIQVPIYAAVAAEHLHVAATGIYLPIQPRDLAQDRAKPSTRVDDLATREGRLSEIERRALTLVDGARSGHFAPLPAKETECTYCSVSGGCRKPRFAMAPLEGDDE